jgi:hypothetical protein
MAFLRIVKRCDRQDNLRMKTFEEKRNRINKDNWLSHITRISEERILNKICTERKNPR